MLAARTLVECVPKTAQVYLGGFFPRGLDGPFSLPHSGGARGVVSGDKLAARSAIAGAYRVMNRVVLD